MSEATAQSQGEATPDSAAVRASEFIRVTHGATIHLLIEHIMQTASCLALTGAQGAGKSVAARLIREELVSRGMNVVSVSRRQTTGLSLRGITAQVLDKPEAGLEAEDSERLFAFLAGNDSSDRCVMLIDDAETLTDEAVEYFRLVSSIAKDSAPQLVLIGKPELLSGDARAAFWRGTVAASWELSPLNSRQAREFVVDTLGSQGLSAEAMFDDGGLAALVRLGEGRFGRLLALLSIVRLRLLAEAFRDPGGKRRLTAEAVAEAAELLDAAGAPTADSPAALPDLPQNEAVTGTPRDPTPEGLPGPGVRVAPKPRRTTRARLAFGLAGAAVVLLAAGGVAGDVKQPDDARTWMQVHSDQASAWLPKAAALFLAVIHPSGASSGTTQGPPTDRSLTGNGELLSLPVQSPPAQPPEILPVERVASLPAAAPAQATDIAFKKVPGTDSAAIRVVDADNVATSPKPVSEHGTPPSVAAPGTAGKTAAADVARAPAPASAGSRHDVSASAERSTPQAERADANGAPSGAAAPTAAARSAERGAAGAQLRTEPAPPAAPAANPFRPIVKFAGPTVENTAQAPPVSASHSGNHPGITALTGPEGPKPTEVEAPPPTAKSPQPAPGEVALLLSRGDQMLKLGDIATARLFYEQAAEFGVARAAIAAGRTYDPEYLASIQADGISGDRATAAKWYRRGAELGDKDGSRLATDILARTGQ